MSNEREIFRKHEKMMDMITDDIMSKKPCRFCNDTGLYAAPNGPDDYDAELCECKQP